MLTGVASTASYTLARSAAAETDVPVGPRDTQISPPAPAAAPALQPAPERREARFRIFARGVPLGGETVIVETTATEWKLTSKGQTSGAAVVLNNAEFVYDRQWRPLRFALDARLKDSPVRITTTFGGGKASSQIIQDAKATSQSHDVSEHTLILPNNVYGAYEAVVARLASLQPGATLRAYIAPQAEIPITFDGVTPERVQTTAGAFQSKHYTLTAQNPGGALKLEVWADDRHRLMRVRVADAALDVVREDVAAVSTRELTTFRENDEDVRVPANGFNLAGTVSKPVTPPLAPKAKAPELPAVILVAGAGLADRDETTAGVPIFSQLAAALADAGYLVIRYDKRGIGQSGGRIESATLADYAEDVRAVVRYLSKRKDVDEDRIAVAGYTEGAAIAMLAAEKEKKIRALVLIAGPGTTGADLMLEQQRHALDRLKLSDYDRQARIELQKRIQDAAISGQGWEIVPPEVRRQAETPWFASLVRFDPAKTMSKLKQPILIAQGDLDRHVPAHHADKLAALANARKKAPPAQVAHFPTLNHLLVSAKTGEVDEYLALDPKTVSPDVPGRISDWLKTTLAPKT
jgi:uncharacterized protein